MGSGCEPNVSRHEFVFRASNSADSWVMDVSRPIKKFQPLALREVPTAALNKSFFFIRSPPEGLRRRRQNAEKYVTDPSQLNLRFTRPKSRPVVRWVRTADVLSASILVRRVLRTDGTLLHLLFIILNFFFFVFLSKLYLSWLCLFYFFFICF